MCLTNNPTPPITMTHAVEDSGSLSGAWRIVLYMSIDLQIEDGGLRSEQ